MNAPAGDKLKGLRKLIGFAAALAVLCGMVLTGHDSAEAAFTCLETLLGIFIGGNAVEHGSAAYKSAKLVAAQATAAVGGATQAATAAIGTTAAPGDGPGPAGGGP